MAILRADARHIPLADESVQCVVTSPPYWGLRDYGVSGQIGLERTVAEYVAVMVEVFREVKRVCRPDATVFLNLGDSYCGSWANYGGGARGAGKQRSAQNPVWDGYEGWRPPASYPQEGLKPKDLMGVPWRVAFALQADGWYLRSDIIWAKPNPMPESVTDRPTRSHEYLFLLSKNERYYYDADAIREPQVEPWRSGKHDSGFVHCDGIDNSGTRERVKFAREYNPAGRNRRSVWTINSEPYPESHFATFPKALVQPCILAGTPERGSCSECGTPWVRVTESTGHINRREPAHVPNNTATKIDSTGWAPTRRGTDRWQARCRCDAPTRPSLVFDPFGGSGTVGEVCEALGRRWVTTDLSHEYCRMAKRRTCQMGLLTGAAK